MPYITQYLSRIKHSKIRYVGRAYIMRISGKARVVFRTVLYTQDTGVSTHARIIYVSILCTCICKYVRCVYTYRPVKFAPYTSRGGRKSCVHTHTRSQSSVAIEKGAHVREGRTGHMEWGERIFPRL